MGAWADISRLPPKRLSDGVTKIIMPTLATPPGAFYKMPKVEELAPKEESKIELEIIEAPLRQQEEQQKAWDKFFKRD